MRRALHTTKVSSFIPPSQQMKLGAFCVVKEVRRWSDAGGGTLEINQWQICGCGSQQLEMMKLYFQVRPHLHTLKPEQTPGGPPAASMFLHTGNSGTDGASVLVRMLLSSFMLGVQKNLGSGLSSSIRSTPGSTSGTSGSDQNIWVLLGTLRFRLSQHSQPLGWNFSEVCRYRLMSTTVQIPEMLLLSSKTTTEPARMQSQSRAGTFSLIRLL